MPNHLVTRPWLINAVKTHNSDACLIWPFAKGGNPKFRYGTLYFDGRVHAAHRVSFFLAYGHWPTPIARHTCDTPACVNPRHIIEGTKLDNSNDMMERKRNRQPSGERNGNAKLTAETVTRIRAEYPKHTQQAIADTFGIDQTTVSDIVLRKVWKHI